MASTWQIDPSTLDLASIDPRSTDQAPGGKDETKRQLASIRKELAGYQRRLFAERRQSLLVILQAMDTGGKDGTIRHVFKGVNPMGVKVTAFGVPTQQEREHDFLWRVHPHAPGAGFIGVFNRSHYEDVVAAPVRGLVSREVAEQRYPLINCFEEQLSHGSTQVVKLFLHISKQEQLRRLLERANNPAKRWKFDPADLDDRARWNDYLAAYERTLRRTATDRCPWFVIPADRKWYRNWAVASLLLQTLERMDPQFPDPGPFEHLEYS